MPLSPLTFIRQTFRDFRNTGALAPSTRFLGRKMALVIPHPVPDDFRVLEVGPGTGPVTRELVKRMDGCGRLSLWEISPHFCEFLRGMTAREPSFKKMRERITVNEGDVRSLNEPNAYDAIISGLPFNCFSPGEVRGFLDHFRTLLKPGGTLTWFEYVGIRKLQAPFVGSARRAQLRGIHEVTHEFVRKHQFGQHIIPVNFPPARVRHLRFDA
ncbi:MAG TPA: methyltransferase domain-containing protein [Planctomycetota bacterium]|nr:methyltransferase domain-containing protein [Planctomycetota bacterium]